MDAATRRNWHRKRRRLKQIEARAREARDGSSSTVAQRRGFFSRLWIRDRSTPPPPAARAMVQDVVDQSDAKGWTWGFDPSFVSSASTPPGLPPRSKRSSKRTRSAGSEATAERRVAKPAGKKDSGGANDAIEARAASRPHTVRRLRRFVVLVLLFVTFAPAVPVALLRVVPPLTSSIMIQRWWEARIEGRDFDLEYDWVPATKIAPSLRAAVVVSEDQRFYDHAGFDWKELRNAVDDWQNGDSLRGASTISQQVAKNLFLWPGRSFLRKAFEAWLTVWIEWLWPKQRILEVYLNIAEMGDGTFGAEAAARRYFKRPAAQLNAHESALLAALLPTPLRSNPANPSQHLRKRQRWILRQI